MLVLAAATLVVCAPGYPGNTAEAQPAMDALARSLARAGHVPEGSLAALYEETESGCMRRLAQPESSLLLATLPFYLVHEQEVRLVARLSAMPQGSETLERWTLVTGKDHPPSLEGYTVESSAGYSKRFVRAMAPKLPGRAEIQQTSAVLSALKRAANGEKLALLLDGSQAAAMAKLPFAGSLAVLQTSPPMPPGRGGQSRTRPLLPRSSTWSRRAPNRATLSPSPAPSARRRSASGARRTARSGPASPRAR